MALSNAIDQNAISRTLGYALDFRDTQTAAAGVLPVRVAILSPIGTNATTEISKIENATRAKVLSTFGNCPAVSMIDIFKNNSNAAVDVIAVGLTKGATSANTTITFAITGTATAATKESEIKFVVNGTETYSAKIVKDDTMQDIIRKVLAILPVATTDNRQIFAATSGTNGITFTSSFSGTIGNDTKIQIAISGDEITATRGGINVSNAMINLTGGAGDPIFEDGYLEIQFGEIWYNIVVNPFGANSTVYDVLKTFNGTPSENGGTGRWNAQVVKPFIAISGTSESDIESTRNTQGIITKRGLKDMVGSADDLTNALCTAPNSANTPAQIAAAYTAIFAEQVRAKPHLDIAGKKLPVLSLYGQNIGEMEIYNIRDEIAKAGITTVTYDIQLQGYVVQDFITFRRMPDQSQMARDWNYCRNIFIDFNIAFNYQVLQRRTLLGKVIVKDDEIISSSRRSDVIRLSVWKAAIVNFFTQMIAFAYITDQDYSNESLLVELSGTNPKRINTQFAYKRTETVGIASTTAYAGFSFGEE